MQGVARSWTALTQLSLPTLSDVKGGMVLATAMATGATDECGLSTNGEEQIAEVRKMLLEEHETLRTLKQETVLLTCSPLLRARLTCEGLFKDIVTSPEPLQLESLREIVPIDYVAPTRWANAKNRILDFERWIAQRNESNIVVVGHSHYFRHMLGVDFKFSNCEIWKVKFFPEAVESADAGQKWSQLERICGSSTAKATFGAEGPDAWAKQATKD
jgi:broad specificity phosphatase PhoE